MHVRHAYNNWQSMPDMQIQLYSLPSKISSTSIGGTYRTELLAVRAIEVGFSTHAVSRPVRFREPFVEFLVGVLICGSCGSTCLALIICCPVFPPATRVCLH
eukprot:2512941-Rhodomonas_salina.2